MAGAVLSFALEQLSIYVRQEGALLGGLRDEVRNIKDELGQMKAFLGGAEEIVENHPHLKGWIGQVRDVAYDAEDILDDFALRFGRHYAPPGLLNRLRKLVRSVKTLKARRKLATGIQSIKGRITNIAEARERYKNQFPIVERAGGSSSTEWHDTRGDALLVQESDLIGIERSKKKLMDMLSVTDSQLRVVSVVGMGGLGKTTLVKKVYDDPKVKNQFENHAWITVSQSFKIETLLKLVLEELNQPVPAAELGTVNVDRMKQRVHDLLRQRKYVVVFDDIWKPTDWDAIRMAFPRNNCSSRILITSRNIEVGQAAMADVKGDIYPLNGLQEDESWALFCRKAFRGTPCPPHLKDVSEKILKICGGLPLAIVVIGSVLATKSRRTEEWDLFYRSMGRQLTSNDRMENMARLLSLSYYDLPDYLRVCFLYLSILPEDDRIKKSRLIQLWIAEGFVQEREGMTLEDVAESYLNELVDRSLVQAARREYDGTIRGCQVHDVIQQQIIHERARENNITTTTIFDGAEELVTAQSSSHRVRRLVIHPSSPTDVINSQVIKGDLLKSVRSLILFGPDIGICELLSNNGLRLLNVLELSGSPLEEIPNVIYKLFHLKYLGLSDTGVRSVSKLIGNLQKLETLNLGGTYVTELPGEISQLQQLRHLMVDGVRVPPHKIGNLRSLQTLECIDIEDADNGKIILNEIGNLSQLRRLAIMGVRREHGSELCSILGKLTNLRSLWVRPTSTNEVIDLQYLPVSSTPPKFLRKLELWMRLDKVVPQWISSLHGLTRLTLRGSGLKKDDVDPLEAVQDLPNLVDLELNNCYEGEGLCFKAGGFQSLKRLNMALMKELRRVIVEEGAMPSLEEMKIRSCESLEDLPTGLQHLTRLQLLRCYIMPDTFGKCMKDKYKQSNEKDYNKIAHIPRLIIEYYAEGGGIVEPNLTWTEMEITAVQGKAS